MCVCDDTQTEYDSALDAERPEAAKLALSRDHAKVSPRQHEVMHDIAFRSGVVSSEVGACTGGSPSR